MSNERWMYSLNFQTISKLPRFWFWKFGVVALFVEVNKESDGSQRMRQSKNVIVISK